ncbi:Germin-like protein subfamily 3 member 4 [Glycine soja]
MLFLVAFSNIQVCLRDCDNLQDTCPAVPPNKQIIFINGLQCKNPVNVAAQDFRTTKLSKADLTDIFGASLKIVSAAEFNGLNTHGLSIGKTDLDGKGLYFQKFLKVGDVFVFHKALFHFCLNTGFEEATVFSVYNSQNLGFVSLSPTTFDQHWSHWTRSRKDSSHFLPLKLKLKLSTVSSLQNWKPCTATFKRALLEHYDYNQLGNPFSLPKLLHQRTTIDEYVELLRLRKYPL